MWHVHMHSTSYMTTLRFLQKKKDTLENHDGNQPTNQPYVKKMVDKNPSNISSLKKPVAAPKQSQLRNWGFSALPGFG